MPGIPTPKPYQTPKKNWFEGRGTAAAAADDDDDYYYYYYS